MVKKQQQTNKTKTNGTCIVAEHYMVIVTKRWKNSIVEA
jgi:hypothetical protein